MSRLVTRILIPALTYLFLIDTVLGADGRIAFRRISIQQGLSQNTVYGITQDRKGYLWIGTGDGLNRYDSYEFTTYRHEETDTTSLISNRVSTTFMDDDGTLWIGSTKGLSRYNPHTDDFSNFLFHDTSIQIYAINQTDSTRLIMTTEKGLMTFDTGTGRFTPASTQKGLSCLCRYRNYMLIGSQDGIYSYSPVTEDMEPVIPELSGFNISDIIYIPGEGCWIATFGNGIFKTDENLHITGHFCVGNSRSRGLTSDDIRVIRMDYENRLWIGSIHGLFVYYPATGIFEQYTYNPDDMTSLGHNSVRAIFMDGQRGMWVGTYHGGLSYYHPQAFRFGNLSRHISPNSLNDNNVTCITRDGDSGNLWIGTNDGGLNYYDTEKRSFKSYQDIGLKSNNIKCIYPDPSGKVYIGTHAGGLSRLDPGSLSVRNYTIDAASTLNNSCYAMIDIGDGTLLLGALNGLYLFDKQTGQIRRHPVTESVPQLKNVDIYVLLKDSKDRIWICTNSGLFLYDTKSGKVDIFEKMVTDEGISISNAQLVTAIEDSYGNIWIGSDQGLLKFDEKTSTFRYYHTQDGLPNNYINGILEDNFGRLWISTNKGLSCFDQMDESFKNYNHVTGSGNNQFLPNACCTNSDNLMYFGSINGLIYFSPSNMPYNPYSPAPFVTDIHVFNRKVRPEDKVVFKKDDAGDNIGVSFPSENNIFSIKYVVINPISFSNNRFAYTLKNFDNQWYETTNREISYSNLPPGKYTFMLKSCNDDGIWSKETTSFPIHITPMWYQTLAFKIFCLLVAAGIIIMAIRFYIEHADRKRIQTLSQEKIRFYINLSHELRTPLTLIQSPLEELQQHSITDSFISDKIGIIQHNASKLLYMVNQMLDFRKAETGMLKLRVSETDVDAIISDVFSLFEPVAGSRNMDYIFDSSLKSASFPVDRLFLERILSNLLSNAFKFTPDNGMIRVSAASRDGFLTISVKDNGPGISGDNLKKVFERFYKVDESSYGSGIGLSFVKYLVGLHHGTISVASKEGEGCEFTVKLPADIGRYSNSEIVKAGTEAGGQGNAYIDPSLQVDNSVMLDPELSQDRTEEDDKEMILIVEDNPEIRNYLKDSFGDQYLVRTAANGEEALASIREKEPDIVITDVMMPVMDGITLLTNIKTNIQTSHIPVIILTAKDSTEDELAGISAGADEYISKPFSISILKAKVSNLLKARDRFINYYSKTERIDPEKITQNSVDAEFLKKVIEVTEQNMGNPDFSVDNFCDALCMARSTVHLKMRAITGDSVLTFIRKMRMNRACELLAEQKHSIGEISEMVGFNSASYFATIFKRHIGCMPSEYIRNLGDEAKENEG